MRIDLKLAWQWIRDHPLPLSLGANVALVLLLAALLDGSSIAYTNNTWELKLAQPLPDRVAALFNWTTAFLGRGRPQRVITVQQVFARRALQLQPAAMPNVQAAEAGRGAGDHDWSAQHEGRSAHPHHPEGVQR